MSFISPGILKLLIKRKKEEKRKIEEEKKRKREEEKKRKEEEERKKKEEEDERKRKEAEKNKRKYKHISQDKIVKKKVKKMKKPSEEQSSNIHRGGGGFSYYGSQNDLFNATTHYTGNRPILKTEQKECLNCHNLFTLPYNEPNKKICSNCVSLLSSNNINLNQKKVEPRYEPITAKEYFEQNKDRYYLGENDNNKLRNSSLKTRRINRLKLETPICSKCKMNYNPKINKRFYFCNNCDNYICGNCSKNHYLQFPEHKCSQTINGSNDNNKETNSQKYINTDINDVYPNKNKNESIAMCMSCGIEKNEFPNKNFIECQTCKKSFCDTCSIKHYRLNQTHSQTINNVNNYQIKNKTPIKEDKCKICGIIHRNAPMRIFYDCYLCKGCVCFMCRKTHDSKYYNHRLNNARRYENKNIVNNNNQINENDTKPKKEEIKKGIFTIYGNINCFICQKKFDQFYFCNKCMRIYCLYCNSNNHKCNY